MSEELARLWPAAEGILDQVLDLPEPARTARAIEACAGDPALERALRELLRADREAADFLEGYPRGSPPPRRPRRGGVGA